jgi:hypothetical protein
MPRKQVKDFRFWDGEGKNFPDGSHRLVLLANSDEEYIYNENGLSTIECFKFLLLPREKKREVWFSFGYDVCKILCDVPLFKNDKMDIQNLETLWKFTNCLYKGFKIHYIPRKIFSVHYDKKLNFYSTDTFSFFQCSFLSACEKWKIDVPDVVIQGKKDRNIFDTYTREQLIEYNFLELRLAKQLIYKLYDSLRETNLVPESWHGPGALAGTYFKSNGLAKHWGTINILEEMKIPIRHAYFGGRIDISCIGQTDVYRYDIASAYPHALTDCMSFENAGWFYQSFPYLDDRHALYHVTWNIPKHIKWGPFPWRKSNGTVLFPRSGEGWYWGVEVFAAESLFGHDCIKRIGAYYPWGAKHYPFKKLIEKEFEKRKEIGTKTGAGLAIKLLLNSFYGKLCQSIGKPTWQNYIWAGYITAFTRARMLDAIKKVGDENVVSIQTDGIYTKKQMYIDRFFKGELGSWEPEGKANILLVGAGLYTILQGKKIIVMKSRGMPANLNHAWILGQWKCFVNRDSIGEESFTSSFTSFVGIGKALHQKKPFGQWVTETKTLSNVTLVGTSKRVPTAPIEYEILWKEFPLMIKERPRNSPILSHPYENNKEIKKEEVIENETSEN